MEEKEAGSQCRSLMWGSIPERWDHTLSRRQTLNGCATQAPLPRIAFKKSFFFNCQKQVMPLAFSVLEIRWWKDNLFLTSSCLCCMFRYNKASSESLYDFAFYKRFIYLGGRGRGRREKAFQADSMLSAWSPTRGSIP